MPDAVSITYKGKPLAELERLIDARITELGESAKDAVVATAINTLGSLRTLTRKAKAGAKHKHVQVEPVASLVPSITRKGGKRQPCLRNPAGQRIDKPPLRVVWAKRWTQGVRVSALHVFKVTPEWPRFPAYYCVAPSAELALKEERARADRRIKRRGGLARNLFAVAMGAISTRNPALEGGTQAQSLPKKFLRTSQGSVGGAYAVKIRDMLDYAALALSGGRQAIDLAMMKAANKTAGLIQQRLKQSGDLSQRFPTPFPEIKRRR